MKIIVGTALIAAQTAIVAQPAFAAEIQREATVATGTFAGLRLRVPMGGSRAERAPRVGLALAPTVHGLSENGEARLRIGEGLEFGFSGRGQTPAFSLAGRRLGAEQDDGNGEGRDRGGIDTGEALLIAGGAILLIGVAGLWIIAETATGTN
jgi:hypothetical protein